VAGTDRVAIIAPVTTVRYLLTNAPSETLVLRPDPAEREAEQPAELEAPPLRRTEQVVPARRRRLSALVD
jgi:hypothetical protein